MESGRLVGRFELPARCTPIALLKRLRRAGYVAGPLLLTRCEHVFLDTQDGRLGAKSFRLSLCVTRRGAVWRLAGTDGESEWPVRGRHAFRSLSPDAPGVPAAARGLASGRLLLPLVRLRGSEWTVRLRGPTGSLLVLRGARFSAALAGEPCSKVAGPFGLLTVRWLDGDQETDPELSTRFRDHVGLRAASGDACCLALLALGIADPGAPVLAHLRIRPDDLLPLATRKIVGQQLLRLRANVKGALEGLDPEYLHDLRVAIRRLRSALRLLAEVLGPKRCNVLRAELGWIGQILGAVRDLDVFIRNLQAQARRLAEAGGIATLLAEELERQREPARRTLCAALASRRFAHLMSRLEAVAASPAPHRPRGRHNVPVVEVAPILIRRAQKRVLKLGRTIGLDSPAADLHRLRILFKRLRYTCEFFREAFVEPAAGKDLLADYVQAMVRFQDCLGEHQDAVVAMARIQELATDMVRRGALAPDRLMDLGGLVQVQREIARKRRGRLRKLWARFDKPSMRKRVQIVGAKAAGARKSADLSGGNGTKAKGGMPNEAFRLEQG
jgi:CHAD domain-containing protein